MFSNRCGNLGGRLPKPSVAQIATPAFKAACESLPAAVEALRTSVESLGVPCPSVIDCFQIDGGIYRVSLSGTRADGEFKRALFSVKSVQDTSQSTECASISEYRLPDESRQECHHGETLFRLNHVVPLSDIAKALIVYVVGEERPGTELSFARVEPNR